ncbi:MAG: prolipoprotein diacylglyceryl transferase, partial [Chloroflexota bacterium]
LVFAVIGARLYHVLTPSPSMAAVGIESPLDYFRNPMQLINIRSGGLGIYGAIAGGALGLLIYTRRQRVPAIAWADLAAVGLALGQFIGRWGNFFNQELYGAPTTLPWAVYIDPIYRLDDYVNFETFHPAFLYESLWNLMAFLVLLTLARRHWRRLQVGDLTALYLVFYAVGRILLEMVRLDSRTVSLGGTDLGLPVATLVSIIVALPMAGLLLWRHVLQKDS